jgi:predicted DNA-binding transcriptional regulator YafY
VDKKVSVLIEAMKAGKQVSLRKYQTPQPNGGIVSRTRRLLGISHVFMSQDGNLCVTGWDTFRKTWRTFRLDRAASVEVLKSGSQVQENLLYPADFAVRRAHPFPVNGDASKYLSSGKWSRAPVPALLQPALEN